MTNKSIFYFLILAFVVFSCRQNAKDTFDYSLLQVDTNYIKVFKYDSALYTFPKFSEPLALTNDDVKLVDSLLVDAVQKFNQTNSKGLYEEFNKQFSIDSFTIDLTKYKRQYFPYKDNNGQKVFQLICFSSPFADWKEKIYSGRLHGGITKFTLRVNLSDKKADEFSIGGYG
ncbi:hypothetical protein [Lacibacter luteus]|uniref:hypothetical protein n=1 Tax=Lacibacter luteus TaxID=2508719 RepID=UPI00197BBCBA|nr:hypothetical protein [Lacibacter luteus]